MSDKYNQNKAQFDAKHTTQIKLKLNIKTDSDILSQLKAQPKETGGKQGYIKRLIREDIKGITMNKDDIFTCFLLAFANKIMPQEWENIKKQDCFERNYQQKCDKVSFDYDMGKTVPYCNDTKSPCDFHCLHNNTVLVENCANDFTNTLKSSQN